MFKEAIGLFSCDSFGDWWQANEATFVKSDFDLKSRGTNQSFPKDKQSRRILTFPNPEHFVHLATAIEKHWTQIEAHANASKISISRLEAPRDSRAVGYFRNPKDLTSEKVLRRVGKRYYLHVDIARFFPSVYLHRLEAIFPGTNTAGRNNGLGSKLDNLSRKMQSEESIGLPLGPDTSFVLAEVLAAYIDAKLPSTISAVRHVDDISIFADSIPLIEKSIVALRSACEALRLELNSLKTYQGELPDELEADWVSELRPLASSVRSTDSLITFFDRSLALHKRSRDNRLLNYVISASSAFGLKAANWKIYEAFLLTCLPLEPRTVAHIGKLLLRAKRHGRKLNTSNIVTVYRKFLLQHAPMNHGYEVNQALWSLYELNFADRITPRVWSSIFAMSDNFVAVTTLWLRDHGVPMPANFDHWTSLASAQSAYTSENWLLCHEAHVNGWIPTASVATSQFWNKAIMDGMSFIDPLGGVFAEAPQIEEEEVPGSGIIPLPLASTG
jgi:hypothetical protein